MKAQALQIKNTKKRLSLRWLLKRNIFCKVLHLFGRFYSFPLSPASLIPVLRPLNLGSWTPVRGLRCLRCQGWSSEPTQPWAGVMSRRRAMAGDGQHQQQPTSDTWVNTLRTKLSQGTTSRSIWTEQDYILGDESSLGSLISRYPSKTICDGKTWKTWKTSKSSELLISFQCSYQLRPHQIIVFSKMIINIIFTFLFLGAIKSRLRLL